MLTLKDIRRRARYRAVTFVSTQPKLYFALRRATGMLDDFCIAADTELVIEGYPRSANSTTVSAFLERQPRHVKVAHHKHHAAQLLCAADRGVPAVMLIREPQAATLSYIALIEEARRRSGGPGRGNIGFTEALRGWLAFYRAVLPRADHVVIAPFEEVISDIPGMIQAINTRFRTDFAAGPPLQKREQAMGWHALPTPLREEIKRELHASFAAELVRSTGLKKMLQAARVLHQDMLGLHERRR